MVGAGGTGMSGLARLLAAAGARVAGEDREGGETVDRLRADGIPIAEGPGGAIPDDAALVVATAAAGASHPTLRAAMDRGVPVRTYAQMLGELHRVRTGVSVAGTHGKSTTTCLLTWILMQAGLDPGFIAGATCASLGGNARPGAERVPVGTFSGRPGLLVTESCEFDRSFHHLHPTLAIVNNVEAEHLDCYGSLEEVVDAFQHFAASLPPAREGGYLLIAHEGAHRERVAKGVQANVETFGTHAKATHRVERLEDGTVRVLRGDEVSLQWRPRLMGAHNALNGAAGAGGVDFGGGGASLQSGGQFGGTGRGGGKGSDEQFQGAFSMSEIDQRPRAVFQVAGSYPSEMRQRKVEGVVTILFIVDETGRVVNPRIEKSSHPEFEAPAIEALRQWKFEPAIKAGKRVSCRMRVPIRFQPR